MAAPGIMFLLFLAC